MKRWQWRNLPVPIEHLVGLIAGVILNNLYPLGLIPPSVLLNLLGWILIGGGIFLAGWATWSAGSTNIEKPTDLIVSGVYAYSRNPMYVVWTLLSLGIGLVINNLWLLILILVVALFQHFYVIPREERFLLENFGEAFEQYLDKVGRYF
jgi:protein-S-isoprenylcysteine O-methyltransferase Ste14